MIIRAELPGQDTVEAEKLDGEWRLEAVGCSAFLSKLRSLFATEKNLENWLPLLSGESHVELLLRELALKARGEWRFPYKEEELCHCRGVSLKIVDEAILNGAHTPEAVSRKTSASTSCGTCREDVCAIIKYRKGA